MRGEIIHEAAADPVVPQLPGGRAEPRPGHDAEQRIEEKEAQKRAPYPSDQRAVLGHDVRMAQIHLAVLVAHGDDHLGAVDQPLQIVALLQGIPDRLGLLHIIRKNQSYQALHGNSPFVIPYP